MNDDPKLCSIISRLYSKPEYVKKKGTITKLIKNCNKPLPDFHQQGQVESQQLVKQV